MDFPIAREIDEQYEQNCVVCTAPSKTFNIAGLQVSNIFIPNKNLRRRFRKQVAAAGYSQVNTLGLGQPILMAKIACSMRRLISKITLNLLMPI